MDKSLENQDTLRSSDDASSTSDFSELIQAARILYREFSALDAAIATKLAINASDLRCLNELEYGSLSPKQISERLELSSGSVTSLIDRLEKQGFVVRKPSASDRRAIVVEISTTAFHTLGPVYKAIAMEMVRELSHIPDRNQGVIEKGFSLFAQACRAGKEAVKSL